MKLNINKIPLEGLTLEEEADPKRLDLETDIVHFRGPLKIKAQVSKITNAITASLELRALINMNCSRCLDEFEVDFKKGLQLNYTADSSEPIIDPSTNPERSRTGSLEGHGERPSTPLRTALSERSESNGRSRTIDPSTSLRVNGECSRIIDLDQDIRAEIILDYTLKPLCSPNCKGLCPRCGKNLNEGACKCVSL